MTKVKSTEFPTEELRQDILTEAKVLRVESGFAEMIAKRVMLVVEDFLDKHPIVTKSEIDKLVVRELKKYNKDLAYIYHNRDKII